jgi:N-acetylglucosaminyl-diphospho-decaprenol L-rhamnosyltransferase
LTNKPENPEQQAPEPVDQVSVVIVSCNRIEALRASLTALGAKQPNPALQIVVVDNGSTDGSASLDNEFTATQFLRLPQNFGLTKALNIGIRACDGNYLLFLHEDVEIRPDAVEKLREELANNSDTGGACPLLVDEAGNPMLQVRDLPDPANPDPPFRPGSPGPVPAALGAAIMVRRFLINAMRRVDERYGNYGSDLELAMQVRRANKRIVIVEGATAIHRPQQPDRRPSFVADRQLGTAAFLGKHHGFVAGLNYRIARTLGALVTFQFGRFRYLIAGQKIDGA